MHNKNLFKRQVNNKLVTGVEPEASFIVVAVVDLKVGALFS